MLMGGRKEAGGKVEAGGVLRSEPRSEQGDDEEEEEKKGSHGSETMAQRCMGGTAQDG
jgi:hypothetical protein